MSIFSDSFLNAKVSDLDMLRLLGHSRWPFVLVSTPVLPLAHLSSEPPSSTAGTSGDDSANHGQPAPGVASGHSGEHAELVSPLTYGKVFGAIPRMTKAVNTPVINQRISATFGLPALENSFEFKKIYSSGRDKLR